MTAPLISLIIPTCGRPTLSDLLETVPVDNDLEVLVVADTHAGDFLNAVTEAELRCSDRPNIRWLAHDGGQHSWGHPQRNYGMSQATGRWLAFSQDDNIFAPDAFDAIADAIYAQPYPRPLLFRIMTWQAGLVWDTPGLLQPGHIDADCIVVPNDPERLGAWGVWYQGDWHFIATTAQRWNHDLAWRNDVIASALPDITRHPPT